MIPTLLANDPKGLIFDEPDNFASRGFPTYLGPMDLRNLVYNVHIYCGARSPVTGQSHQCDRVCGAGRAFHRGAPGRTGRSWPRPHNREDRPGW